MSKHKFYANQNTSIATPNRAMRAALGQARRAAARAGARRCFFWGAAAGGGKDPASAALLAAAARDMGTAPPPMLASANPALRRLAEQYARAKCPCSCSACPTGPSDTEAGGGGGPLSFSCPTSGFPSHCSEHCYQRDTAHHAIADDLRMIHQDYADLQSGRKFAEFDFPGPPPHDYVRGDLNNWVSFLSDREFKNALGNKIGWTRSEEEKFIEARSMRLISSMFTFPLTIAHAIYWKSALGDPAKLDQKKDEDGNQLPNRITILGPRAEATLPTRVWLELNAIFPEAPFALHFVGPEIADDYDERVLDIPEHKLSMRWSKATYEEVHEHHELPDLFVIFNSGLGHGTAGKDWDDALEILFNQSDFKTVLFTSHSKDDSARDYSALSLRQDCRFLSHPAVNPFMSLKRDVAVTNLKYIINRSPPLSAPRRAGIAARTCASAPSPNPTPPRHHWRACAPAPSNLLSRAANLHASVLGPQPNGTPHSAPGPSNVLSTAGVPRPRVSLFLR